LTAKGRQVTQKIIPLAQAYEAQALIDFSTQETDQLRRLLKRVHVNMGKNSTAL
jgi:DNA-binding MarR family transcriptional regulator